MKQYYVYILASKSQVIYVGVTNDLIRRVYEHRECLTEGFTKRYNVKQLVYYEETSDVYSAITREKEIKGWTRAKKVNLINSKNPLWKDLWKEIIGDDN